MDDARVGAEGEGAHPEAPAIAVEVRQGRASDRGAIAAFLEEAYGTRAGLKGPERWTWQFVENPYAHQPDGTVPVWIAVDGERVVGQIAVQEAALQVQDDRLAAGWILDVMVLPNHRGGGLGHQLYEAVARDVPTLVTLTMADATRKMGERLGAITLGEVHQLTRWVRPDPATVRRYLMVRTEIHPWARRMAVLGCRVGQFHRLLPLVVNPLLRLRDLIRPVRPTSGATKIVEVSAFGDEVDDLWRRTRSDYPVIFPRDAQFLNWRFVECPEPSYRRFVASRDGETVGYLVLRNAEPVELPEGHIVDLYAARGDTTTIEDLIRHSLAFFGDRVAAIESGTSVPEIEAVLRRHGFVRTRTHRPTCVCADAGARARLSELKDTWFFSRGDHDWDQIHVA